MNVKYLKKKGDPDSIYHVHTEGLAERADMEPFVPASEKVESVLLQNADAPVESGRLAAIKNAISLIPVENYGKAAGGRPSMPRVADVSEIMKSKVSVDEIVAAMTATEEV